jgi:hypothetical protein
MSGHPAQQTSMVIDAEDVSMFGIEEAFFVERIRVAMKGAPNDPLARSWMPKARTPSICVALFEPGPQFDYRCTHLRSN